MTEAEARAKNNLMLMYSGVDKLHSLGFKGEGIKIAVLETAGSDHSGMVLKSVKVSAPNHTALCYDGTQANFMRCIVEKVDIINVSMAFMNREGSKAFVDAGGIIFGATGNKEVADFSGWEHVIDVGALWETMVIANYSAKSDTIDLVSFPPYIEGSENYWFQPDGTSFASPFLAGVTACLIQYWKSIGYKYTPQSVRQYLIDHAVDLLEAGHDRASGYGMAKVDIMNTVKATIGQNSLVINGIVKPIPQGAVLVNGNTMVPFRAIGDAINSVAVGQEVVSIKTDWEPTTKTAVYFIDTK